MKRITRYTLERLHSLVGYARAMGGVRRFGYERIGGEYGRYNYHWLDLGFFTINWVTHK
jgi:hypothetical protein